VDGGQADYVMVPYAISPLKFPDKAQAMERSAS